MGDIEPTARSMEICADELLLTSAAQRRAFFEGEGEGTFIEMDERPTEVEFLGNGPQYMGRCYGRAAIVFWPRANRSKVSALAPLLPPSPPQPRSIALAPLPPPLLPMHTHPSFFHPSTTAPHCVRRCSCSPARAPLRQQRRPRRQRQRAGAGAGAGAAGAAEGSA